MLLSLTVTNKKEQNSQPSKVWILFSHFIPPNQTIQWDNYIKDDNYKDKENQYLKSKDLRFFYQFIRFQQIILLLWALWVSYKTRLLYALD